MKFDVNMAPDPGSMFGEDTKTLLTFTLDAHLLKEVRVLAAENGRSLSELVADQLEALVRKRKAYANARRRAIVRLREGLDLGCSPPSSRDELHGR